VRFISENAGKNRSISLEEIFEMLTLSSQKQKENHPTSPPSGGYGGRRPFYATSYAKASDVKESCGGRRCSLKL
jgi:hypothetical protein